MKKSRKGKGNESAAFAKKHAISAMMKTISKIDWSNPYKDFIK
jgi:hypothetical protein